MALTGCLTMILTQAAFSTNLQCAHIFLESGPQGKLKSVQRTSQGSTGGKWMADENGMNWFVKKDVLYPELQTSAEPIASEIYRHFGFTTPDTVVFHKNGVHYSASRDIGKNHSETDLSDMNSSQVR